MATRPFATVQWPPPKALVDATLDHVLRTGEPETVEALHKGPIGKAEPFLIVREISIPRGLRGDGRMAPCPMCQPNKFYEGKLVWFTQLEALAVIGHCCAARETRLAAEREYREREARERATNYLLETLPRLESLRGPCEHLEARVSATQTIFDRFRGDGALFQRALRRATKGDGRLAVAEVVGTLENVGPSARMTAGSTVQTRDAHFGELSGRAAVAERCTVAADYRTARDALRRFPAVISDDAVLEFLEPLADQELLRHEKALRDAQAGLAAVRGSLDGIASFFTTANAERITRWGTHRDAPERMQAALRSSRIEGNLLFEITGRQRRVGLLIPPEFWPNGRWQGRVSADFQETA